LTCIAAFVAAVVLALPGTLAAATKAVSFAEADALSAAIRMGAAAEAAAAGVVLTAHAERAPSGERELKAIRPAVAAASHPRADPPAVDDPPTVEEQAAADDTPAEDPAAVEVPRSAEGAAAPAKEARDGTPFARRRAAAALQRLAAAARARSGVKVWVPLPGLMTGRFEPARADGARAGFIGTLASACRPPARLEAQPCTSASVEAMAAAE